MIPPFFPAARRARSLPVWPVAVLALALSGCNEKEKISTYETPRVEPRATAFDPASETARLDHMFAAIVPADDKAWFFKLVVPGPAADDYRKPFEEFVAGVDAKALTEHQPKAATQLPAWTLPEGWTEQPGDAVRAATIVIPCDGGNLDLTVTSLPFAGDWSDFLTQNVNRWLFQLQQPELDLKIIEKLARKLSTKAGEATTFEFVGVMKKSPMGGAMPAGHPPIGGDGEAPEGQTASTGPASSTPAHPAGATPAAPASSGGLTYDAPAAWSPGPTGAMRKASFTIASAGGKAEVSVTTFGATGQMADPVANAQRWATQAGLTNPTDAELKAASKEIKIDGVSGRRFEFLASPDAPGAQSILAAMAVRGDEVWFVKLSGDRPVVEAQRDAFDKFLASLKFPSAGVN